MTTAPAAIARRASVEFLGSALLTAMVVWLAGWNRQPIPDDRPSIAVLAFESSIDDPEHAQLARRLTEGVTSELARLGTVSVASYTSAMQFASSSGAK